jgi:MFS family permease
MSGDDDRSGPGRPVPAGPETTVSSPAGRWLIVAAALGSGVAFLDGTVVNVALPAIGDELGGGFSVLQWVLDGYLLTLSALLVLGGAVGDRYGRRRVFLLGLVVFTVASLCCGLAPSGEALILARLVQGVGGALLIPGSLALIDSVIRHDDRGARSGRGPGSAVWPPRWGRSWAGGSSTRRRGGGCSSSTSPSRPRPWW